MTNPAAQVARSHRELIVWQRALELIEEVYRISEQLPQREAYGIVAQIRRASISVAANIAEGHARRAPRDYARFLTIANGSLREMQTYAEVPVRGSACPSRRPRGAGCEDADEAARCANEVVLSSQSSGTEN